MRTTVLGLGNLLLSDEGVGVRVVAAAEAGLGLVAAELERLGHRPLATSAARAA